jgi:hypothetical protein
MMNVRVHVATSMKEPSTNVNRGNSMAFILTMDYESCVPTT